MNKFLFVFAACYISAVQSQPAPGGEVPINKSDPSVYEAANAAVVFINVQRGLSDQIPKRNLLQVINGTVQAVNGEEFRLNITLADSVCKNTKENLEANATYCPTGVPFPVEPCQVEVLYRHWETVRSTVQYAYCENNVIPTRPPPGSQHPVNISDPHAQSAANWAVSQINIDRGFSIFRPRESLFALIDGTIQEVDGKIYRLRFTIGDSSCPNVKKYVNATSSDCPVKNNVWLKHCSATILYNSWEGEQEYKVQNHTCEKSNVRRSALAVNSPEVTHVADILANAYNRQVGYSCCTYKYVVADVLHASSSVSTVQGSKVTTIEVKFRIGESFCTNNDLNADRTQADCPIQPGLHLIQCVGTSRIEEDGFNSTSSVHCSPEHVTVTMVS